MSALLLFLLKANISLFMFYLAYQFAFRKLTFYNLNRFFLLFGIVFSSVYPFIDLSALFRKSEVLTGKLMTIVPVMKHMQDYKLIHTYNYWSLMEIIFWTGAGLMTLRLLLQMLSLYRLHLHSRPSQFNGFHYRKIDGNVNPFSFWKSIYLNPVQHEQKELTGILQHEQIHIQQWHTADVLLSELCTVCYWFNPVAWLIKQAVKENLEYVTDHQLLLNGTDPKSYQYSLLRISNLPQSSALVNNFNFLTIKKRIAMMNKKRSSRTQLSRYVLLLPALMIAAFVFTISKAASKGKEVKHFINVARPDQGTAAIKMPPDSVLYYVDSKKVTKEVFGSINSRDIESINVLKDGAAIKRFGAEAKHGVVIVTTKNKKNDPEVVNFMKTLSIGSAKPAAN